MSIVFVRHCTCSTYLETIWKWDYSIDWTVLPYRYRNRRTVVLLLLLFGNTNLVLLSSFAWNYDTQQGDCLSGHRWVDEAEIFCKSVLGWNYMSEAPRNGTQPHICSSRVGRWSPEKTWLIFTSFSTYGPVERCPERSWSSIDISTRVKRENRTKAGPTDGSYLVSTSRRIIAVSTAYFLYFLSKQKNIL